MITEKKIINETIKAVEIEIEVIDTTLDKLFLNNEDFTGLQQRKLNKIQEILDLRELL